MRKIILSAVFALAVAASAHAQQNASANDGQKFRKGTNVLSGLIGIGSSLGGFYSSSQTPAYSVNFEHGAWQAGDDGVVSIGAYLGRKSYKYGFTGSGYSYTETWSYTIFGIRSAYHYTGLDDPRIDLYGGLMLSYNNLSYKEKVTSGSYNAASGGNYPSAAGFTGFVGGRYFFNPRIGANVELGYGVAYLNAGISLKF